MYRLYLILSILLSTICFISCEKRLRFEPDRIDVWSDNENINVTYGLDMKIPYVNVSMNVLRPIENLDVHLEGILQVKNDLTHYAMVNTTHSVCRILSFKNAHPLAMFVFAQLKSHGNIPNGCPIEKDIYYVSKFWIPDEMIPKNLPEMIISGNAQLYAINDGISHMIFNVSLNGNIIYKDVSTMTNRFPLF